MKTALITGITGQDGSYLAEFLLAKGYDVHGIKRRSSSFNTERIDHLYQNDRLHLHYGDLTDASNLIRLTSEIRPDEIYNLGAQSHVKVSFESPEYTANSDALGTLRLLEAMRILGLKRTRFYQASTSELYGDVPAPQDETTPFSPCSPYAAAKLYSYWITSNYRDSYGFHASNGILFNHESPRRGETFVTRKITRAVAMICVGDSEELRLGNLDSERDWGFAGDYVEAMWLMLQQDEPGDYVIATGKSYRVRDFVDASFRHVGIEIKWIGSGLNEIGVVGRYLDGVSIPTRYRLGIGQEVVKVDAQYFRPVEVNQLRGDSTKARQELGWESKTDLDTLVSMMIDHDMQLYGGQK